MIKLTGLSVKYRSTGRMAVDSLSLEISPGERVALLGPSGCGKTTVLRAVLGLLTPEEAEVSGSVETDGGRISAVLQRPALFPWLNVRKNVAFPLIAGKREAGLLEVTDSLLKMCGLGDCADHLPHQLSAGMQQRVSFLRALADSPELMLLDEPFSSLDIATKTQLLGDFQAILARRGVTALFVTHDIGEALEMGDRILVLTSGPARIKKEFRLKGLSTAARESLRGSVSQEYEN